VNARQTLRIDVTMTVETQVQKIEVSESVAVIITDNGIIGDSKGTQEIGQLPMNFRAVSTSPLGPLQSSPNVQQDSQGNIALGGATANMVGYSVDGISRANIFLSAVGANPYHRADRPQRMVLAYPLLRRNVAEDVVNDLWIQTSCLPEFHRWGSGEQRFQ
jgi:hypothetical protein